MEIYNVQPAIVNIRTTKGDTFNVAFEAKMNDVLYVLTGKQIDIKIKKFDGTVIKTLTSAGASPSIIISASLYSVSTAGFSEIDTLKYDVQITSGTDILTIQKGKIIVEEEITTAA